MGRKHMADRPYLSLVLTVIGTFLLLIPAAFGEKVPEKLVYDLSWTGINVGTATQEIAEDGIGRRIVSTARSNDWLSVFFPVEDLIESSFDRTRGPFPGMTRHYRLRTREGRHQRDREIAFDQEKGVALYTDNRSGEKAEIQIAADTFDIYGSFYYVRYLKLEVGRSIYVNILDGKKPRRVEIKVLRKEKIKCVLGEVDTIVIQPVVRSEGVFEGKGTVHVWLTDDVRRIPVRARTKVAVGSVTATLIGVSY